MLILAGQACYIREFQAYNFWQSWKYANGKKFKLNDFLQMIPQEEKKKKILALSDLVP